MSRLFDAYRAIHCQAFMPIFVQDNLDSRMLVEACVEAGMAGIEYTLRREDAREMIPWIRQNFPELYLLVGSTLDSEIVVQQQRRKYPQLMTVAEVADLDVHGFVSMVGWREETIRKYAKTHVIMPTAMTVNEALFQVNAGAHFIKMLGSDLGFVKRARGAAAFDYCPILVTGGVTAERIDEVTGSGAILTATGFDLTLKEYGEDVAREQVVSVMRRYLEAAEAARARHFPALAEAKDASPAEWLDALPHCHPFGHEPA